MNKVGFFSNTATAQKGDSLIQACRQGKWSSWGRTFLLRNENTGDVAVVSLNLLERIVWYFQETVLGCTYKKLTKVFDSKNVTIISPFNVTTSSILEAIKIAKKTLQGESALKPLLPYDLAKTHLNKGDFRKALDILKQIEKTSEEDPKITQIYRDIATSSLYRGQLQNAQEAGKSLSLEEREHLYCDIAKAYFVMGNLQKACALLEGDTIPPHLAMPIYEEFAMTSCIQGKYSQAMDLIRKTCHKTHWNQEIMRIFEKAAHEEYRQGNQANALHIIAALKDVPGFALEDASYARVSSGADKVVWVKKFSLDTQEAKKAYYTPYKAFGISRAKWLQKEYEMVQKIKLALRGNEQSLAVNWVKKEGKEKINKQLTIEVDFADVNFEHTIRDSKVSLKQRISLVHNMLSGLTDLHKAGFIHGDLKPENCLIYCNQEQGRHLKINDFGRSVQCSNDEVPYEGNTRFAPPEGKASKKGEVYAAALMMIRAFEEMVLGQGEIITIPEGEKDSTAHPTRRGIDKYILEHKAFLSCENKDTKEGRLKNALRRETIMGKLDIQREALQDSALRLYISKLSEKLKNHPEFTEDKVNQLKKLLHWMTNVKPTDRPTMQQALEAFNALTI